MTRWRDAAAERIDVLPLFRRRGLRGRGEPPGGLLRAHGALMLRFKGTPRIFQVVLPRGFGGQGKKPAGSQGHPAPKYIPLPLGSFAVIVGFSWIFFSCLFYFLFLSFGFFPLFALLLVATRATAGPMRVARVRLARGARLGAGCPLLLLDTRGAKGNS